MTNTQKGGYDAGYAGAITGDAKWRKRRYDDRSVCAMTMKQKWSYIKIPKTVNQDQ